MWSTRTLCTTFTSTAPLFVFLHRPSLSITPISLISYSRTYFSFSLHRRLNTRATMTTPFFSNQPQPPPDHVAGNWYSIPDLRLRDHFFTVPLDYTLDSADSPKITVFAREVVVVGKEDQPLPFLLYLQGGPGFESPRPTEASGWISKACEGYRLILLDQAWILLTRGTGLSTALTTSSMLQMRSSELISEYLKHFRSDNIVKDAEFIRVRLVPDAGPWTILGQSYGGFCAVTYLSFAPEGLKQALITGGLPPIGESCTADRVYHACFEQVVRQNEKYYERFPQDVKVVHDIVNYLANRKEGGVRLPSGGILTPKGLQTLGLSGLGASGGFERLHYMFERAWDPALVLGAPKQLSYFFLNAVRTYVLLNNTGTNDLLIALFHYFCFLRFTMSQLVERWSAFDTNPLYALLHEAIYCEGSSSKWAAHRIRGEHIDDKFDAIKAAKEGHPVYFTGEMVFPWMFDEIPVLKHFKDVAHTLAHKTDWPPLYDIAQLRNNKVPVAAAVYYEDMYVNFKLSTETASQIAGIRLWVTNEYMHSGLRDSGCQVFDHLMGMLNGKKPLF
ncbi:hypothetical protein V2J09_024314 [Rumex salicifolius]